VLFCLGEKEKRENSEENFPTADSPFLPMASSSSHPPPDTAKASGDDSEVPTADAGTMDTGSVGDEGVDWL
jgi:hypothetical protein